MRFGFKTPPQGHHLGAVLEVWRAADEIDVFESGWTSDHFYPMHADDLTGPRLEGWTTLTWAGSGRDPAVQPGAVRR